MRIGFLSPNTLDSLPADQIGSALEERGYESLWIGEHPHLPVGAHHPTRGEIPKSFGRMMDPYLALLSASLVTQTLLVATGISLVLERSLLVQAKQIATLDQLSGGRFVCGVGVGWSAEELRNGSNIPFNRRFDALSEYIAAMRIIWTLEEPTFQGEFYQFGKIWSYPKPLQSTGPPILVGGGSPQAQALAVSSGDGWCPLMPAADEITSTVQKFLVACEKAGRNPDDVRISFVAGRNDPRALAIARDAGVHRVVIGPLPEQSQGELILPLIDSCARYVADYA
jgi:probable F420-dependent oxidoreductase